MSTILKRPELAYSKRDISDLLEIEKLDAATFRREALPRLMKQAFTKHQVGPKAKIAGRATPQIICWFSEQLPGRRHLSFDFDRRALTICANPLESFSDFPEQEAHRLIDEMNKLIKNFSYRREFPKDHSYPAVVTLSKHASERLRYIITTKVNGEVVEENFGVTGTFTELWEEFNTMIVEGYLYLDSNGRCVS